jgi:filamentous hemagglutinin
VTPAGEPERLDESARELDGLASDMAEVQQGLQLQVTTLSGSWEGAAFDGYAAHVAGRRRVLELAWETFSGSARAVRDYARRISEAQHATRQALADGERAGLRLAGDQVDPASLLPPDPARLLAAADLERRLAEAGAEAFWAASQLALDLRPLRQLAEEAESLLGDRSGLTPGGFMQDVGRGAVHLFWETGLSGDALLGAAAMGALGNPEGLQDQWAQTTAPQGPAQALEGLLPVGQMQDEWRSGHPGEAVGTGLVVVGSLLSDDPESERRYVPTPKHDLLHGWGTRMDLDHSTAQKVLDRGVVGPNGKQIYGYRDGRLYKFQPDNAGGFHGYPVSSSDVPLATLREMRDAGTISEAQYRRFVKDR